MNYQRKSHIAKYDTKNIFPMYCMVFFAQHERQRNSECGKVDAFNLSKPFMISLTMFIAKRISFQVQVQMPWDGLLNQLLGFSVF